jgi:hypothetical protein
MKTCYNTTKDLASEFGLNFNKIEEFPNLKSPTKENVLVFT